MELNKTKIEGILKSFFNSVLFNKAKTSNQRW